MKRTICPGKDLGELAIALTSVNFRSAFNMPTNQQIRRTILSTDPMLEVMGLLEDEVEERLDWASKEYDSHKNQEFRRVVEAYSGSKQTFTRESDYKSIQTRLQKDFMLHVKSCGDCSTEASEVVTREANNLSQMTNVDPEDLIKGLFRQYFPGLMLEIRCPGERREELYDALRPNRFQEISGGKIRDVPELQILRQEAVKERLKDKRSMRLIEEYSEVRPSGDKYNDFCYGFGMHVSGCKKCFPVYVSHLQEEALDIGKASLSTSGLVLAIDKQRLDIVDFRDNEYVPREYGVKSK